MGLEQETGAGEGGQSGVKRAEIESPPCDTPFPPNVCPHGEGGGLLWL